MQRQEILLQNTRDSIGYHKDSKIFIADLGLDLYRANGT